MTTHLCLAQESLEKAWIKAGAFFGTFRLLEETLAFPPDGASREAKAFYRMLARIFLASRMPEEEKGWISRFLLGLDGIEHSVLRGYYQQTARALVRFLAGHFPKAGVCFWGASRSDRIEADVVPYCRTLRIRDLTDPRAYRELSVLKEDPILERTEELEREIDRLLISATHSPLLRAEFVPNGVLGAAHHKLLALCMLRKNMQEASILYDLFLVASRGDSQLVRSKIPSYEAWRAEFLQRGTKK